MEKRIRKIISISLVAVILLLNVEYSPPSAAETLAATASEATPSSAESLLTSDSETEDDSDVYYITFDADGGTVYDDSEWTVEVEYNTKTNTYVTEATNNVVREGYTFKGWYTEPEGGGSSYSGGKMGRVI